MRLGTVEYIRRSRQSPEAVDVVFDDLQGKGQFIVTTDRDSSPKVGHLYVITQNYMYKVSDGGCAVYEIREEGEE